MMTVADRVKKLMGARDLLREAFPDSANLAPDLAAMIIKLGYLIDEEAARGVDKPD